MVLWAHEVVSRIKLYLSILVLVRCIGGGLNDSAFRSLNDIYLGL